MPRQVLPHLTTLLTQIEGLVAYYCRVLDDEFLFGSGAQIPQVATIFDRVSDHPLHFAGESLSLAELLTLIAYRYGFEKVKRVGFGGYAIVLGHADEHATPRRVMRLVPEHHVRDVTAHDIQLDENDEPIRDPDYPLLMSDLFLIPRHTTKLAFYGSDGWIAEAGGYPARLHCQFLPEVRAFNMGGLNQAMARDAGERLEAALATVGISVADAHGGNGGVLMGSNGQPLTYRLDDGEHYVPMVLDYGYYSEIGPKRLANILERNGVTRAMVQRHIPGVWHNSEQPLAEVIAESDLPRRAFGGVLYDILHPRMWIDYAEEHWQTIEEKSYPPLQAQARLKHLYPSFDEVNFPQHIEEYRFAI